jgi:hypothetical protein
MFDSPIVQNQEGYVWMEVKGTQKQESPITQALYARYLRILIQPRIALYKRAIRIERAIRNSSISL